MNPILMKAIQYTIERDPALKDKSDPDKSDIKFLQFWNQSLTELPEGVRDLSNLEVLDLTGNCLTSIPPWIVSLKKLRTLVANCNCLEEFPPLSPNLTVLALSKNKIKTFPSLKGTKIVRFTMNDNPLCSLPPFPFPSTLEMLSLSYNQITSIPNTLEGCQSLWLWEMAHNQLSTLPPVFCRLQIKRLVLNHNCFKTFPTVIKEMGSLNHLEMLYNQIESIPEEIRLQSLGINGNPCTVSRNLKIDYIDVRDCPSHRKFITKK